MGSIFSTLFSGLSLRNGMLPTAILLLVMLMIVPVPSFALDIGFIVNITMSLAILMVALNAAKPLDFSAFPTVLLMATLFRLSLNVASTRVVLVNGHQGGSAAGHVIEAFGSFLIGGNYIVGIFVFSVLMIINLVVITKGAGRVSEVSARFTLDALPGKQMAIDADLNAGLITPEDARTRRQEVATEADFYGSMDGSSKFVKGDAVAGMLILTVNIIGGLLLGVISHGLSIQQAAQNYVILAIGDALVAQVPALLLSIAAATIVTRVASPLDLAGQIASQFGSAMAWIPVTVILTLLGFLPGMPHLTILSAAGMAGTLSWKLQKAAVAKSSSQKLLTTIEPERLITWQDVTNSASVTVELGFALVDLVDERRGAPLMGRITGIRRQISRDLGFVLPLVQVKDNLTLPANNFRITIAGIVMGEDEAWPNEMLALDSGDIISPLEGRTVKDPSFGLDAVWIEKERRSDAIVAGYTVVDASTVIATLLNNIITGSAAELFGLDDTQALLDALKTNYPQLAQGLSPQPYSLASVMTLCRALLNERVPLRDFRRIAEAMVECGSIELSAISLTEAVRQKLGALIVQAIVPHKLPLPTITFDAELEDILSQAVRSAPDAIWPFDPALSKRIVEVIRETVEPLLMAARAFAIVTSPLCRPAISSLLRAHMGDIFVLSYLEIPETKAVDVIAIVGSSARDAALLESQNGYEENGD
jgi:flagellar biosynthesis protein FlhA